MEPWQYLALFLVGIGTGFMNVMAGGGSLLSLPAMLLMGVPGPVANGTNRIAILAQNATAVATFFRKGYSDFRLSATLALAALPGAVAGAYAGTRLEGVWFDRVVGVVMLLALLAMTLGNKTRRQAASISSPTPTKNPRQLLLAHLLTALVGVYGGFIQIGTGLVLMPVLHKTLGLDLVRVNMHKAFIVGTYSIAALIVFAWQVEIYWLLGLCLAAGYSIGAALSANVQIAKGEAVIRWVLNIALVVVIIKLLFF